MSKQIFARWQAILSVFDFEIDFIKGESNSIPDFTREFLQGKGDNTQILREVYWEWTAISISYKLCRQQTIILMNPFCSTYVTISFFTPPSLVHITMNMPFSLITMNGMSWHHTLLPISQNRESISIITTRP